jgi:hypothetical protein
MSGVHISGTVQRFGQTFRKDNWWLSPVVVFIVLSSFVVYATWAALQGVHYTHGSYISPLYSPELFGDSPHAWFGPKPGWWPSFLPYSPALLILWAPGLFRFTCYYYRGAYYKAFFRDPVSCTVTESTKKYAGENSFPLIMQNIHRYFMYIALLFLIILSYDVYISLWHVHPVTGIKTFGIGVGTLILTVNVILLGGYTLGCHSLRHVIGGILDHFSSAPVRHKMYQCVSCFNSRHMLYAWMSLFWVAFSDIYVRLCSMGILTDWKLFI